MNDVKLRKYVEYNLDKYFTQKEEFPVYEEYFTIIEGWDDNWDDNDDTWEEEW